MLKVANRTTEKAISDLFLEAVEQRITQLLNTREEFLPQSAALLSSVASHLCLGGTAKRVRPLLTMFFADAAGVELDRVVELAVAAELLHSASLLHDDVVDDASTRRGISTANTTFGNSVAVLGGNYLLSLSFSLLENFPQVVTRQAIDVVSHMTRAAIAEIEVRGTLNSNAETWKKIAVGKTGRLFSWCGQSVALAVDNPDAALRFERCGYHIGTAFQLADDIRDLCQNQSLKEPFADIRNKEPSFPLLLAAQQNPRIKSELLALWAGEYVKREEAALLGRRIIASGALEHASTFMKIEIEQASDALGHMINTVGGHQVISWLTALYQSAQSNFADT